MSLDGKEEDRPSPFRFIKGFTVSLVLEEKQDTYITDQNLHPKGLVAKDVVQHFLQLLYRKQTLIIMTIRILSLGPEEVRKRGERN